MRQKKIDKLRYNLEVSIIDKNEERSNERETLERLRANQPKLEFQPSSEFNRLRTGVLTIAGVGLAYAVSRIL